MPYTELLKWVDFFTNKRPVGWRDDYRAYLGLKAQGVKASPESIFSSLEILTKRKIENQKPDHAVPKGKFLDMMLKARNGDGSNALNTILGKENGNKT